MNDRSVTVTEQETTTRVLHIVVLSSLAVAQPLFSVLAQEATFFVAHDASICDLVLFVSTVILAVPIILMLLQLLAFGLSKRAGLIAHLLEIALLSAMILAPIIKRLFPDAPGLVVISVAGLGGCAFGLLYQKQPPLRSWLTLMSPAALLFPLWFLFFTPVRTIIATTPVADTHRDSDSDIPVVLLVLDELPVSSLMIPDGRINVLRFPTFAKIAKSSWWFRNASSVAQSTSYALPAILTGRYPSSPRIPLLSQYPENLFTHLGGHYELRVVEIMTRLCPPEFNSAQSAPASLFERISSLTEDALYVYLHVVLPADLTGDIPDIDATWKDFRGDNDPAATNPISRAADSAWVFEYFLDQIDETEAPELSFLHLNLPHVPWKYLPGGLEYGPAGASIHPHGMCGEHWCGEEWEVIQGWQRHLLQLVYADRLLARLIERLEQEDRWDRSLVIVTADHGASFRHGQGRREITTNNAGDILGVPLFVKLPGQQTAEIDDRNVETIDILPTIADVIGAPLEWPVDGRSVFSPPERPEKIIFRSVRNNPPEGLVFPADLPNVMETVERMTAIFGDGSGPEDLFRIGPFAGLVGRDVSSLAAHDLPSIEVTVQQAESFAQVDPTSGYLPAHIVGTIPVPESTQDSLFLAVAVNGTIRATTQTYDHRDGIAKFSALTPEEAWHTGHNQVEIFIVRGDLENARLQPTHLAAVAGYQLVTATSGGQVEAIFDSTGHRLDIIPDALQGQIDLKGLQAKGWAADLRAGKPAERLLAFRGNEFLFSTALWVPRPAIAKRENNDDLARCGFRFTLPSTFTSDSDGRSPRFFAVRGDRASEILAD